MLQATLFKLNSILSFRFLHFVLNLATLVKFGKMNSFITELTAMYDMLISELYL